TVGERCVDAAVLIFVLEQERDFVVAPFAWSSRERETTAAPRVEPQTSVFVRGFVPFNKDDRFIRGLALCVLLPRCFVDAQVFMVQHPFGLDIVRGLVSSNSALKDPISGQTIKQEFFTRWLLRGG